VKVQANRFTYDYMGRVIDHNPLFKEIMNIGIYFVIPIVIIYKVKKTILK